MPEFAAAGRAAGKKSSLQNGKRTAWKMKKSGPHPNKLLARR